MSLVWDTVTGSNQTLFSFNDVAGIKCNFENNSSCLQYFQTLMTDNLVNLMVVEIANQFSQKID